MTIHTNITLSDYMMETYYGQVRTPADAIKLFEACRIGVLPRVQRRLSEKERGAIRSGSVFVWDEREASMRRWTDGKSWSASRVSGSFLTYREMEGKRGSGFGGHRRGPGKTPDSGRGSDDDRDEAEPEGYRYKADGLLKQSFSITTSNGHHLHLISYYSRPPPGQPELVQPSNDPILRNISPVKGLYPESSLHDGNPALALTRAPTAYALSQGQPRSQPHHPHAHPHAQAYHAQYAPQSPYGWAPSPVSTPPYAHHPPPGYPRQMTVSTGISSGAESVYQHQSQPISLPPLHAQPRSSMPQYCKTSPVEEHAAIRNTSMASTPDAHDVRGPSLPPINTPPSRSHSASPSRSSHSDTNTTLSIGASTKTSISSLLQANPSGSEPGNGSTCSSPRALASGGRLGDQPSAFSEDRRTTGLLNSKFCI